MKTKMKKFVILLMTGMFFTLHVSARQLSEDSVPKAVKESCKAKFPLAKKTEWKLKQDKNYEAEFMLNGTEIAAKFSPDGKWLETESAINDADVPAAVKNTISKQFPGYKSIELQKVETPGSKELIYEIHLKKEKETVKAQFSPDGKVLNQSSKTTK
jgi:roadblock/LC7 domain-containing protein